MATLTSAQQLELKNRMVDRIRLVTVLMREIRQLIEAKI